MVLPGILRCSGCRIFLDIHCGGAGCPQQQCPDGQDPTAAAQIQYTIPRMHQLLQQLQAEPGGVVLPGAEAGCRIDLQHCPVPGIFTCLPGGLDEEPFSHGEGLEILLPVVRPVLLPDVFQRQLQGAEQLRIVPGVDLRQHCPQGNQLLRPLGIVRQVHSHCRVPLGHAQQILVNVVPLAFLVLQKLLEICRIRNGKALDAQIRQHGAKGIHPGRGGNNLCFDPIHVV